MYCDRQSNYNCYACLIDQSFLLFNSFHFERTHYIGMIDEVKYSKTPFYIQVMSITYIIIRAQEDG